LLGLWVTVHPFEMSYGSEFSPKNATDTFCKILVIAFDRNKSRKYKITCHDGNGISCLTKDRLLLPQYKFQLSINQSLKRQLSLTTFAITGSVEIMPNQKKILQLVVTVHNKTIKLQKIEKQETNIYIYINVSCCFWED